MHARTPIAMFIVAALLGSAAPLRAQSLADLAKKADDQKKAAAKGTKTYTGKDLRDVPPATAAPSTATSADASAASAAAAQAPAAATTTETSATPAAPGTVKDQAYYAAKVKELQSKLDRDQSFLDALQSQINALTTDFVNRDDPAQRSRIEQNRNKAIAEQGRLQKDITADKKAITDFQEEARKAGAPPGWLR
jgi:hypothetical protein